MSHLAQTLTNEDMCGIEPRSVRGWRFYTHFYFCSHSCELCLYCPIFVQAVWPKSKLVVCKSCYVNANHLEFQCSHVCLRYVEMQSGLNEWRAVKEIELIWFDAHIAIPMVARCSWKKSKHKKIKWRTDNWKETTLDERSLKLGCLFLCQYTLLPPQKTRLVVVCFIRERQKAYGPNFSSKTTDSLVCAL